MAINSIKRHLIFKYLEQMHEKGETFTINNIQEHLESEGQGFGGERPDIGTWTAVRALEEPLKEKGLTLIRVSRDRTAVILQCVNIESDHSPDFEFLEG